MRELQRLNTYRLERDGQHLDESSYSSKEGINGSGIVDKRIGPVRIIGYVATTYGRRSADSIKRDIDTYASWSELKCASSIDGEGNENRNGTSVQGVFFDETPNGYDPDTAEHLASLHAAVKEHSGLGDGFVGKPRCFLSLTYASHDSPIYNFVTLGGILFSEVLLASMHIRILRKGFGAAVL